MPTIHSRREFLRTLGVSAAALPFVTNLTSLGAALARPRQRLVVVFSPNGVIPTNFWPDATGTDFALKESMKPFEPFKKNLLVLHGICDKIKGDGDSHMRGIGCLLTGAELYPGNIQGGSHTPAGWSSGISIDQEIKNFLQKDPATRTRFGSLELGVMVPERADTWTRLSYAGGNKPVTPIDDPYQLFGKLYGKSKDQEALKSVLDDIRADLETIRGAVGSADRKLLEEHAQFVREMERELRDARAAANHPVPELEPGTRRDNDNMPKLTKMNLDLLAAAFTADFARVATFQFTNSVGGARMRWLGIDEGHHQLSHEPDSNVQAVDKLTRINKWYAEQIAYLAKKLADTPEPGGEGSMLDHTTIIWTNELGKGNSHTLNNIPFVLLGGGLDGIRMGRSLKQERSGVAHNRLLLSLAHGFGHHLTRFGNPDYCSAGPLSLS